MEKEIIIDGIDVSGCEYHTNLSMDCTLMPLQNLACKNNPNCYYKQLKRLEAENKELGSIIECKNGTISTLANIRDRLKAENTRLKEEINKWKNAYEIKDDAVREAEDDTEKAETIMHKYHQALQEIKDIASRVFVYGAIINIDDIRKDYEQILQKISEVEDENRIQM